MQAGEHCRAAGDVQKDQQDPCRDENDFIYWYEE